MFKALIDYYFFHTEVIDKLKNGIANCPCCGYKSIDKTENFEICPVCFWEDDVPDDDGISGANGISLSEAKENFRNFGACSKSMLKNVLPKRIVEKYGRK